jgi:site-specific DNA recombinase
MKRPAKTRAVIDHEIPLRGVLKCHCGNPLSGAASRGKAGKYFYYYKCRHSKHNNISATKAHEQLMGACGLMSLPMSWVDEIRAECRTSVQEEVKNNQIKVIEKKQQLADTEEKLFTVEEKWIRNEITRDTYDRWYGTYNDHILTLKGAIERLSADHSLAYTILEKNLHYLTDMRYVYSQADTLQKREFIQLVFDTNLYYQNGIYRTPTMLDVFTHNHLKMKGYLIYEKKGGFHKEIPPSRERGIRTPGPVTVNGFQDRRIRPLCHLSLFNVVVKSDAKIGVKVLKASVPIAFFAV